MYWEGEAGSAAGVIEYGSSTGYSVWEDIEQADRHRSYDGIFLSDNGASDLGRVLFSSERIGSGYSFISFISNACPWGRRHQIIFHDRQLSYNLGIIQMYDVWVSGCRSGSNSVFGSR